MRTLTLGLVAALAVGACQGPAGRLFRTTLATPDGSYPLPIVLGDETDLVIGIEPGSTDGSSALAATVAADPGDPSALVVRWLGGACDNDAGLSFWISPDGYALTLQVNGKPGLGCIALGVPRAVRIRTSKPIPANSIFVSGGG